MPSANVAANAALVIGLLSPLFMALMPNYKWLFGFLLTVGGLFAASLGIIGAAVDAEAAKPNESLDAQLGYAINFWEVVTAASLVAVSTAVSSEAKMRLLIIAFLLSFTPPAAQADDLLNPPQPALARIQAHLDHCKDTQPGNINEMLCAIEADRAVDTLLNALYGKIVAKLKKAEDPEHDIEDRKELLRRLVRQNVRGSLAVKQNAPMHPPPCWVEVVNMPFLQIAGFRRGKAASHPRSILYGLISRHRKRIVDWRKRRLARLYAFDGQECLQARFLRLRQIPGVVGYSIWLAGSSSFRDRLSPPLDHL